MILSGIFNNKKRRSQKKTRDTWTGKIYEARNQAYQALAPNEEMDPAEKLGWYALCKKYPGRFEDVTSGRRIDASGRLI